MKKKLNVFCVLMLILMATQVIMAIVLNFSEHAQAFREGWEDGREGGSYTAMEFFGGLLIVILGVVCFYLIIRSLVSMVRFILNVNRDKVFVWNNVTLLRWAGWGMVIPNVIAIVYDLLNSVPVRQVYVEDSYSILFGIFCLIMAEVFAIGLKLKEEQDLTI